MTEITELLDRAARGESAAANRLMPMIYDQLCSIAHRQLKRLPRQGTLATTALVHEAYLALFGDAEHEWRNGGHFFSYAAKTMRRILIERARKRLAYKRGGEVECLDIDAVEIGIDDDNMDLLALDQALTQMAQDHPRLVQVVELRFFAGLSVEDAAASLGIDPRSVERDWQKARAFINRALDR